MNFVGRRVYSLDSREEQTKDVKRSNLLFVSVMHLLLVAASFMTPQVPNSTLAMCSRITGFCISLSTAAGVTLNSVLILYIAVALCLADIVLQTFIFAYKFIDHDVSGFTLDDVNVLSVAKGMFCVLSVLIIFPHALYVKYHDEKPAAVVDDDAEELGKTFCCEKKPHLSSNQSQYHNRAIASSCCSSTPLRHQMAHGPANYFFTPPPQPNSETSGGGYLVPDNSHNLLPPYQHQQQQVPLKNNRPSSLPPPPPMPPPRPPASSSTKTSKKESFYQRLR